MAHESGYLDREFGGQFVGEEEEREKELAEEHWARRSRTEREEEHVVFDI